MDDPLGVVLLLGIGVLGLVIGSLGLRRGKVVAVFDWKESEKPVLFWYGIVFQLGLGAVCLGLGIAEILGSTPAAP